MIVAATTQVYGWDDVVRLVVSNLSIILPATFGSISFLAAAWVRSRDRSVVLLQQSVTTWEVIAKTAERERDDAKHHSAELQAQLEALRKPNA